MSFVSFFLKRSKRIIFIGNRQFFYLLYDSFFSIMDVCISSHLGTEICFKLWVIFLSELYSGCLQFPYIPIPNVGTAQLYFMVVIVSIDILASKYVFSIFLIKTIFLSISKKIVSPPNFLEESTDGNHDVERNNSYANYKSCRVKKGKNFS